MNRQESMLGLIQVPGLGPVSIKRLIEHFHSPEAVWTAPREEIKTIQGIRASSVEAMDKVDWNEAKQEQKRAQDMNVRIATYGESAYPKPLYEIYDPPSLLYMKGEWKPEDETSLAIVGTRNASHYGIRQAYSLAQKIAERGITVVSGLARGIDIAAHRGALAARGRTVAVIGSGLARLYPPQHKAEAQAMENAGAVISEYSIDTEPLPMNFPKRNRIISGLSLGVIVVEAGEKSGALITAHIAIDQGREVFALPGEIDNPRTTGVHRLIQEGAKLVTNVDEIFEEILTLQNKVKQKGRDDQKSLEKESLEKEKLEKLSPEEKQIWAVLDKTPLSIETITQKLPLSPSVVSSKLLIMEMKRLVVLFPGHRYARNC